MSIVHIIAWAYIEDSEYILLAATKTHYFLPGGHVKFSESIKHALKREISEEMGVNKLEIGKYMGTIETTWEMIWDDKGSPFQEVSFIFEVKSESFSKGKKVISKEEHIFFEWIKISDLKKVKFLPIGTDDVLINYKKTESADLFSSTNVL